MAGTYCNYLLGRHVPGRIAGENVRDAGAIVAGAPGKLGGPYFIRNAHLEVGCRNGLTSGAGGCECDHAALVASGGRWWEEPVDHRPTNVLKYSLRAE